MENASKALIMAGSVLLSMLIIGALVFMFSSLGNLMQTEAGAEEAQKLAEYNKQIETFDRSLYGSEVLSVANLIADYNIRQSNLKGYQAITLEVYIKPISGAAYMNQTEYTNYKELTKKFKELESDLNKWKLGSNNRKLEIDGKKYTAQEIAGMSPAELNELVRKTYPTLTNNNDIATKAQEIRDYSQTYTDLKAEMTEFKNKKFKTPQVEYDKANGRIIKMIYTEVGI